MRALFVAAGGGGDALGVLLVHPLLGYRDEPPLIATYAWERLRVDPIPGPRGISGFTKLKVIDGCPIEVVATSDTIPPGRSTLPRLAASTDARLFVLDPWNGAFGMRQQLDSLIRSMDVSNVVVVDVGGDAVAVGNESALLSPLADALAIAACLGLSVPVDVVVAGPGVDGELEEAAVLGNLRALGAAYSGSVRPSEVAGIRDVLAWHPSEATSVLAASALGIRGNVEIRRRSIVVPLTDRSPTLWATSLQAVTEHSLLVEALRTTLTLEEAEVVVRRTTISELDRERERARNIDSRLMSEIPVDLMARVVDYARDAVGRGVDLITSRRLVEAIDVPNLDTATLAAELGSWSVAAQQGPLWDVRSLAAGILI